MNKHDETEIECTNLLSKSCILLTEHTMDRLVNVTIIYVKKVMGNFVLSFLNYLIMVPNFKLQHLEIRMG